MKRLVSLYSGAGGPDLGFIAAGVLAIGGIALFIGARRRRAEEETS